VNAEENDRPVRRNAKRAALLVCAAALLITGIALASSTRGPSSHESSAQLALANREGPTGEAARGNLAARGGSPTVRSAVYPESAIISNGTVQLGINPDGNLNVPGGTPSSGEGTQYVGLRYVPTNADATSPGCLCEGWGVADGGLGPNEGTTGYANVDSDGGPHHLRVIEFTNTEDSALSVVDVLGGEDQETPIMRVTHDFEPSTDSPNLYDVEVTVENLTGAPIDDLLYRRVMDWDIEPTAFDEFVTIDGDHASEFLRFSSDNGFASANPLSGHSSIAAEGFFTDSGPADHGALFDFGFHSLAPLESRSFNIYYGAADTEANAVAAIGAAQAEVWSFGEPDTPEGPTLGKPNTFIFGFSGVGGEGAGTDARPPVSLVTTAPNHLPLGEQQFKATGRLDNTSESNIEDGVVRIEPGPGLTLVKGANPATLGLLPAESAPNGPSETWTLKTGAPECGTDHTYEYDIYGDFDGSGGAGGERHVHRTVTVPRICGGVHGATVWTQLEGSESTIGGPESGAQISVCPVGPGACRSTTSKGDGSYVIGELPAGNYTIEARPNPSGPHASLPPQTKPLHILAGGSVTQGFEFSTLLKPPSDGSSSATDETFGGRTEDGYPLLYWEDPIHLTTHTSACPHPEVTYAITQGDPVLVTLSSGPMAEGPTGTFTAVAPAVYPHHGYARVTFTVHCSDPELDPEPVEFDVYIDPSGFVKNVDGTPIAGATVTLLRAATVSGSFSAVPNGSAIMSPANRHNPDTTDSVGHFGWDVSAGFYRVRAEKSGCTAPGGAGASVESATFEVPPPVTGIDLRLECGAASVSTPSASGPSSASPRRIGIASARPVALVKGGKARLKLRCGSEGPCSGLAKLVAKPKLTIGKHRFSLGENRTGSVAVKLSGKGLRLLRKAGKHGLGVKLTGSGLKQRSLRLKPGK